MLPAQIGIERTLAVGPLKGGVRHGIHAVKAADAPSDKLGMPRLDLLHPVRVNEKASGRADKVLNALLELTLGLGRRAHEVRGNDGDGNGVFYLLCQIRSPSGLERRRLEPIVICIVAGARDVYRVDARLLKALGHQLAFLERIALSGLSDAVIHFVHSQTDDDRIISAALPDARYDLEQHPHAVFKASAVFVCALVRVRRKELLDYIAVGGVQLDCIHAGLLTPDRGVDEILNEPLDLAGRHGAHLARRMIAPFAL